MGKPGPTDRLIDGLRSQHIALSVAAGLARTQLIPEPGKVYDAQHLSESALRCDPGPVRELMPRPGELPLGVAPGVVLSAFRRLLQ